MFKNKSTNASSANQSTTGSAPSGNSNNISQGTTVEGDIKAQSDIRIDGILTGTLQAAGRVIIGPTGKIDGKVSCKDAVIEGQFIGQLRVSELLNVKDTARIEGDIQTNKLLVQSGAIFNVNCNMGGGSQSKTSLRDTTKVSAQTA